MTDDNLTIGELGAYTNNSMNREGIKKLVDKVNAGTEAQGYTKAETDALLAEKQNILTAGDGITIIDDVISNAESGYVWTNISSVSGEKFDELFYKPSETSSYYRCRYDFNLIMQPDRSDTSGGNFGDNSIFSVFIPKDTNFLFQNYRIIAEWFKIGTTPSTNNVMYSVLFKLRKISQTNALAAVKDVRKITATIVDGNIVYNMTNETNTLVNADFWFKMPVEEPETP